MSNFGIFDKILEKDSICYVKFSFSNNPPEILNIHLVCFISNAVKIRLVYEFSTFHGRCLFLLLNSAKIFDGRCLFPH